MNIQPVILSGGAGTRLWPLSREFYPKQLLALAGDSSLLQDTLIRLDGLSDSASKIDVTAPLIICNEEHRFLVAEQSRLAGIDLNGIMLEPFGRNTAPALTLTALDIIAGGNDAVMLVMPADHIIKDKQIFYDAVKSGYVLAAQQNSLVTFGIVPGHAETGYGYIKKGSLLENCVGHSIAAFVEKPDEPTAQVYVDSGDYLWNSGMFMMKASVWLEAVGQFSPDILECCKNAYKGGQKDQDFYRIDCDAFEVCPSDSIDYTVMEKLCEAFASRLTPSASQSSMSAAVIPLDAGWSDIGSWAALWDASKPDDNGNVLSGDVYTHNMQDSLVLANDRMVAGLGISDMIIIETADAVLVAHKDHAQDVKKLVEQIKTDKRSEHQIHRKVYRPWGAYEGVDQGERFQVKRITVKAGGTLSLQMHHHRAEHWVVVKGTAKVTRGEETFLLSENESTYIPIGVTHRLENPGTLPLEIIEVQSGSYLGEDDIVRLDDVYGRKD